MTRYRLINRIAYLLYIVVSLWLFGALPDERPARFEPPQPIERHPPDQLALVAASAAPRAVTTFSIASLESPNSMRVTGL
jgi:hypothetical protein